MGTWENILVIVIIILAILAIIIFAPKNEVRNKPRDVCCHERKKIRSANTSTCHKSSEENVRMRLGATRKLATFSISLNRTDVESAYITHADQILCDITSDFVQNSGVANGFWRLNEGEAKLLEQGSINVKINFVNGDNCLIKVE